MSERAKLIGATLDGRQRPIGAGCLVRLDGAPEGER